MHIYEDIAAELYKTGYNCAQAVFCAFSDITGLSIEQSAKISSVFGGGMGGSGNVCGAISGACMAIGAAAGYDSPYATDEKAKAYAYGKQLFDEFDNEYATCNCRTLLEVLRERLGLTPEQPLNTPERKPCEEFVRLAAKITAAILSV